MQPTPVTAAARHALTAHIATMRVNELRDELQRRFGTLTASSLTYEPAARGYTKVITNTAALYAYTTMDFEGPGTERVRLFFYTRQPTNLIARALYRVRRTNDAMAFLAGATAKH